MLRRRRLIVILAVGILLVAGLVWAAIRPVPVPADLVEVTQGPMEVTLDVDGKTRIREIWDVSAPIAGTAMRSPVRVGDQVVRGETLVGVVKPVSPSLLDRRSRIQAEAAVHEAEAALTAAVSQLNQAQADLAYAKTQYDRAKTLSDRGVGSSAQFEDAAQMLTVREAARDAAIAARVMAASTLDRVRAALIGPGDLSDEDGSCCVEIRAPATGLVLEIDQFSERPVAIGERLLSIGDPADLEIVAKPLSRDAVRIPDAARARVERWGGAGTLEARLRRIEPSAQTEVSALGIEEQRVEALFDFVDLPPGSTRLGHGYAVLLRIVLWQSPDAVRVPIGALFREGADWAVFVVQDERAAPVVVEIGQRNESMAQVLGGLVEGDVVIAHPGEKIAAGVLVEPTTRE